MQEIADYARNRILFFTPGTITAKAAARLTSSAPQAINVYYISFACLLQLL